MSSGAIVFTLQGEGLENVTVVRVIGREAMNALSSWEVEVLMDEGVLDADRLIGARVLLKLEDAADDVARSIPLRIAEITEHAGHGSFSRRPSDRDAEETAACTLRLVPPEHQLGLRSGYRIFQGQTGPEIIGAVLKSADTPEEQMAFRLAGTYGPRPHATQYSETDWAFVERIAAEEGISFWFESTDAGPLIVFGDEVASHDGLDGGDYLPYEDPSNRMRPRSFFELALTEAVCEEAVFVRDYDVRHPDVLIDGEAGSGSLAWFDYPAKVLGPEEAAVRAEVRLQQLQRFRVTAEGKSDSPRLQPGRIVKVGGTAEGELDGEYLVVSVEHRWAHPSYAPRDAAAQVSYGNDVVMVPRAGPPHRPAVPAAGPRVNGVETAIITGASGEEIHVNDLAELRVRFPWDRSGIVDDKSSTWVRSLQIAMGGSLVIPRVGWEVPVAYYEGDPDRPLVLGRLYNTENLLPYSLPAKKATTALQSATSPGGGSTNEIRLGDDAGSMELFIHASKDQTVSVGGSATTSVAVNATHDVGLSLSVGVGASQTLTVGGKQSVDVVMDDVLGVNGARSESVGAVETNKIGGNRLVHASGSYSELVGALYGIQANQTNIDVKGPYAQSVAAMIGQVAGLGAHETVGGVRFEGVGGARLISARAGYSEEVKKGSKVVTAGAYRATTDAGVGTSTKVLSVKAASATFKAGGPAVFAGNEIEIVAASLDAGGSALSGAFKVKEGVVKIEGTIKRTGGTKIG